MKSVVLVLVCIILVPALAQVYRFPWMRRHVPKFDVDSKETSYWFTQELDHFNYQDQRTWQQRYFVNDTFYNPDLGGPIFVMIGGEGAISQGYVVATEMAVYAQKFGALMLALEHRFYGQSQPFSQQTTENLKYLSSQQGLADLADFITAMKQQYNAQNAPVITFGGSYPGALCAWFRIKYSHITDGSIASSAPVQATLDFYQYLDVVDFSLADFAGERCVSQISQATQVVQSMLQNANGRAQLQQMFNTCTPLQSELDIATFMSNLMGNFMETVQYNDEFSPITIDTLCNIMDNGTDVLSSYAKVNALFLNGQCQVTSYTDTIAQLADTTPVTSGVGPRAWTYQTCAEFGYFQSTDSPNQPFGNLVPLSYYTDMCNDLGWNWTVHINETNECYGGNNPSGATKIVFVNGSIDPWHALSVTHDLSDSVTAILIDGTAHCADMSPARPSDPPGLAIAQQQIALQIRDWLSQA